MDVWLIVSASPHTLSPFTPIQGQHHTMSHIPTITKSHIPTITTCHIPTITIFPYSYNHNVPYPYNQNVPYSNNHNFPILLQLPCPVFLVLEKKIGLYKSYKLILLHVRINCILKKQRCLCNSKIKFQIPPLAGKNLIELFS